MLGMETGRPESWGAVTEFELCYNANRAKGDFRAESLENGNIMVCDLKKSI